MKFLSKIFKNKNKSKEILQLYINNNDIDSYIGLTNFYSFFLPKIAKQTKCKISIRDNDGKLMDTKTLPLNQFGSIGLSIKQIFPNLKCKYGIISCKILADKKVLNMITGSSSHFFVMYKDDSGSLGLVHPQSAIGNSGSSGYWQSNAFISTQNINKITAYIINPDHKNSYDTKIHLVNIDNNHKIYCNSISLNPLSTKIATFDVADLNINVKIASDSVVCNSKPLIFWSYEDDTFGMMHP